MDVSRGDGPDPLGSPLGPGPSPPGVGPEDTPETRVGGGKRTGTVCSGSTSSGSPIFCLPLVPATVVCRSHGKFFTLEKNKGRGREGGGRSGIGGAVGRGEGRVGTGTTCLEPHPTGLRSSCGRSGTLRSPSRFDRTPPSLSPFVSTTPVRHGGGSTGVVDVEGVVAPPDPHGLPRGRTPCPTLRRRQSRRCTASPWRPEGPGVSRSDRRSSLQGVG